MKAYALLAAALFVPRHGCPPKFEIGQTYAEIKAGPCPDIESQAFAKPDSTHVLYMCPSQRVAVVGDMVSHKMVGFFLYEGERWVPHSSSLLQINTADLALHSARQRSNWMTAAST